MKKQEVKQEASKVTDGPDEGENEGNSQDSKKGDCIKTLTVRTVGGLKKKVAIRR